MTIALVVDQVRAEEALGASEAPAALGCDRYTSPLTIWKKLRGLPVNDEKPSFVQEAGEWGNVLEPIVRGKYAMRTGSRVLVPERSFTIEDGWLRATPDGFAIREVAPALVGTDLWTESESQRLLLHRAIEAGVGGLLQCKTASMYKLQEWEEGVPFEHEIQERVEMYVTDMPWADIVCLVGGQRFVGPYRITRDAELEDRIVTDLTAFWRLVREGIEPTPDHTEAWMRHAAERLEQIKSETTIQPDAELLAEIEALRRARAGKKEAEREYDEIKNRILLKCAAAGATRIMLPDGRPVTAYQVGLKPKWKEYALSLGGEKKPPEKFRGTKNSWALRLPESESFDNNDDKES